MELDAAADLAVVSPLFWIARNEYFSLSFDRTVETYDANDRDFAYEVQEISLEYRNNSRYNGVFFSIDDTLVDLNESGMVWPVSAEVGNWLAELQL